MIVRNSQGTFFNTLGNSQNSGDQLYNIGKVFHVVIDSNSPGFVDWSSIGNVYYIKPNAVFPTKEDIQQNLNQYEFAKPLSNSNTFIPFIGELIILITAPSKDAIVIKDNPQIYYTSIINLYNNQNHNSQVIDNIDENKKIILGNNISEKIVRNLLPFEGDNIINSRWGAGLRFSSTQKANEKENFWSTSGNNGDPITLLVNGHNTDPKDFSSYVENINNDASSIYLTSTQTITNFEPKLTIFKTPFTSLTNPGVYGEKSQIVLSSNRIVLNSTRDDIVMYGATNIELGAINTIHLNGQQNIYLNSSKVFLGAIKNDSISPLDNDDPPQPILMGNDTQLFLSKLLNILNKFSSDLTLAVSAPAGSKELSITVPAAAMKKQLKDLRKQLKDILSESTFVSR